jgi:RES domain-containing protein
LTSHPDTDRLTRAVQRCLALAGPWAGVFYRLAAPRWATEEHLLTGAGALRAGGRWHPIGSFKAVYGSLDEETALAESLAHQKRYGLPVMDAMPKTINAVTAKLYRVLDLTDGKVRTRLSLSRQRILQEKWWERQEADEEAITQALGRVAQVARLEGLLVPSAARRSGKGIVYFPDNKDTRSSLEIVNPDQLPKSIS